MPLINTYPLIGVGKGARFRKLQRGLIAVASTLRDHRKVCKPIDYIIQRGVVSIIVISKHDYLKFLIYVLDSPGFFKKNKSQCWQLTECVDRFWNKDWRTRKQMA
jgi:hypothetical protein